MTRGARLAGLALLLAAPTACLPCGHTSAVSAYHVDEQASGDLVVPTSLGYFPKTFDASGAEDCGASNRLCAESGPDNPGCDTICVSLRANAHLAPESSTTRRIALIVRIPGRPPDTTLTLPAAGVEAMFLLTDGDFYFQTFPVTSGRVTPHVARGRVLVELEATATAPDGGTISVREGRYELVNGRYEEVCLQD